MNPFRLFKPNIEKMEKKGDIEGMMKAMDYPNAGVCIGAQEALIRIGEPAVETLIRALKDQERAQVRYNAITVLGWIEGKRAVGPLIQALKDESSSVRQLAARVLGEKGDSRAVEPLIQALKDEDTAVRKTAAGALGELGTAEAVEPLKRALQDTNGYVQKAAKVALKKMGVETHEKGIQTLEELCTEMGILDPMAYVNRAVEELKPHGADASRALAELIGELLDCRSPKITLVLMAAEQLQPTPELIEAVHSVKSARGLVRQPTQGRFSPEIAGRGQVGWTDGTEDRIRRFAAQVLEKLTRENAQ